MTMTMKRPATRLLLLAGASAIAVAAAGCGPGSSPEPPAPPPVTSQAPAPPATVPTPAGEIWQYALGMSWDDAAIAGYTQDFGRYSGDGDDPTGHVRSQGFILDIDAAGVVAAVKLVNDEAALGYGEGYHAYRGRLPFGLTWSDSAADVQAALGDPVAVTGGAGLDVDWTYQATDGTTVILSFKAGDQFGTSLAPDAPLHIISVSGP
jgi:hypothetical protein